MALNPAVYWFHFLWLGLCLDFIEILRLFLKSASWDAQGFRPVFSIPEETSCVFDDALWLVKQEAKGGDSRPPFQPQRVWDKHIVSKSRVAQAAEWVPHSLGLQIEKENQQ